MNSAIWIIMVSSMILGVGGHALAQQTPMWDSEASCVAGLNVEQLDWNAPAFRNNVGWLEDYFLCRAVRNNNVHECDPLSEGEVPKESGCVDTFERNYKFWGQLFRPEATRADIHTVCLESDKILRCSPEKCEAFAAVLWAGDSAGCLGAKDVPQEQIKDCQGIIDGTLSSDHTRIYQALKQKNISLCDQITQRTTVVVCKALLSPDPVMCEKNTGFEQFRTAYCKETFEKMEGGHGQ